MSETFQPEPRFMAEAIRMAQGCGAEHPVGAVVVKDDEIISRACNQTHLFNDPTYHAERLALAGAQIALDTRYLDGCELYSTLEPCTRICAGHILALHVERVAYGASAEDAVAFTRKHPDRAWQTGGIPLDEFMDRQALPGSTVRLIGGLLREACLDLFPLTPRSVEACQSADGLQLHIVNLQPEAPGLTRITFTLGNQVYEVQAPLNPEGLLAWFPAYIARAPRCGACHYLIFPGQAVSQGQMEAGGSRLSHTACCDTLAGHAGHLNNKAEIVPDPR
jgi:tRNA(Arg) A34 adenosine deaminase TadA